MARLVWLIILTTLVLPVCSSRAVTTETVQERGELNCGISPESPGFSSPDENGRWSGLNIDICRAVAAAVLGDQARVNFIPLTAENNITTLLSGGVDLLSMNVPWTLTLDSSLALHFAGVTFYDGESFLVSKRLGVKSALELSGASICLPQGQSSEDGLRGFFREHGMEFQPLSSEGSGSMIKDFEAGRCDVLTGMFSELHQLRNTFENPEDFEILPEVISREPLGPIVRQGDDGWFNIVRWTMFALVIAEEKGVASSNVVDLKDSSDPEIRKLLGLEGIRGKGLGLADDWAYQIIKQVGNYGELFDRNLGKDAPLSMERGLNALWNRGGLHYAPSLR